MRYLTVRLERGLDHPKWKDWWDIVNGEFGGVEVDYVQHHNFKLVKTRMDADTFRQYCSRPRRGKSFADDVKVEEVTRESAAREHRFYLDTIQRYYKDFLDVEVDEDFVE